MATLTATVSVSDRMMSARKRLLRKDAVKFGCRDCMCDVVSIWYSSSLLDELKDLTSNMLINARGVGIGRGAFTGRGHACDDRYGTATCHKSGR